MIISPKCKGNIPYAWGLGFKRIKLLVKTISKGVDKHIRTSYYLNMT